MKIAVVGTGAFGIKHLDGLRELPDAEVVSVVDEVPGRASNIASRYGISHAGTNLTETLERTELDAVILCTPTPMHAAQAIQCMEAGKHVEIEIPLADTWKAAQAVARTQRETGRVCMVGHTRRYNPSHQWLHRRIRSEELSIQQLNVQTFFFRRENINAAGEPRSWTDHLLWHHAAHTIDLFQYQTGEQVTDCQAIQGPIHPQLGIAMDMSIQLRSEGGAICSLSLSFNNDGPLGTFFRYICDNGTYIARYDDLLDGREQPVDLTGVAVSSNGIELQDREFLSAIRDQREPISSVGQVMPCYAILDQLAATLEAS